jgi:tRNA(Ile)-lysidine synthase
VRLAEPEASTFSLNRIFSNLQGLSHVALAVSGGSDSMAMLRMVQQWAPASLSVYVLTVDHGLRKAAAEEALQVNLWCKPFGYHHETLQWHSGQVSTGIQAKARQARYDLMSAWCVANHVEVLLTAHTADDQAETVLMRSLRTSTAKSLAGIWPERDWNGVRVLRPLLGLRRAELRDYLSQLGQAWIEDPSNEDARFERVRLRRELAGETLGLAEQAHKAQLVSRQHVVDGSAWFYENTGRDQLGFVRFPLSPFATLDLNVQDEILLKIMSWVGGSSRPELHERQHLLAWLVMQGGSRRTLGGLIFAKRKREILVGREPERISSQPLMIPESGEIVWDGRFNVTGPVGATVLAVGRLVDLPRRKDIPAFIQAGLPAIITSGGHMCVPGLSFGFGATCKFVRC